MIEPPGAKDRTAGDPAVPLRSRALSRNALFLSIFLIELGSAMTAVALPLLLLDRYGITASAGLAFAARLIPGVLLGPVVGDSVARWDPRRVAAVSALGGAVVIALMPWTSALWQVQVLGLLVGISHMFAAPARLALRPLVLKEGEELAGNGFLITVERLPVFVGPPLAGILVAAAGFHVAFLAEAVTCLAAAGLVLLVPASPVGSLLRPHDGREPGGSGHRRRPGGALLAAGRHLRRAYAAGVHGMAAAVARDRFLLGLTLTGFTYVGAVSVGRMFLLGLAADSFPGHSGFYGYLLGAMAIGAVVGGVLVGRLVRFHSGVLYIVGNVVEAVLWVSLVHVSSAPLALALLFLAGITESVATAVFFAEAQSRLPAHLAGHYYAALIPLTDACSLVGAVLGASLTAASLLGASVTIAALIALPVLLSAPWYLRTAGARHGHHPQQSDGGT
ncbi:MULTISPECIES: MFS transporter [unclassified Streptomyces]|uniref:MFS transporter n=1 Tax=unclassified Streptomyces TaxID=2593676 RepID=UPI002236F837|nr:MFS transporter [Streptomyces sp. SHP 1-2]MCW5252465.1 MFS transporter [Streptomyces sp. SHP 1-2]